MPTVKSMGTDGLTMTYNAVSALGLLQSGGLNVTPGVTAEARDGVGAVAAAARKDWRAAVTVEYIPYDSVTFPPHNGIVQVAGFEDSTYDGAYRVDSVGETYNNQGYPAKSIGLIRYLDNSIPTATTTTTT
jgi:hypothetical protein